MNLFPAPFSLFIRCLYLFIDFFTLTPRHKNHAGENSTIVVEDAEELGFSVSSYRTLPEHVNTAEDFFQWLDDLQFMQGK